MRTLAGLTFSIAACLLLGSMLSLLSDPAGTAERTRVYPFAPPPWQFSISAVLVAALMGWLAVRLLRPGIVGRLVRGRGLTPAPEDG